MENEINNKFITKAKLIHGNKYDYTLVEYVKSNTKVKIICTIKNHGLFTPTPNNHLKGSGCPKCSGLYSPTSDEFIDNSKNIHGDKYDYSLVEYKMNKIKVKIICPIHNVFEQSPNSHLKGRGCPICKESKGETKITKYLSENNINYIKQYRFNDCKDKKPLPFDFYLPDYNTCIEYDGEQHFILRPFFGGEIGFINRQKRDNIKTKYCENNKIKLIRIKYTENIIKKLINKLCTT